MSADAVERACINRIKMRMREVIRVDWRRKPVRAVLTT
jgi:hypothetical protein